MGACHCGLGEAKGWGKLHWRFEGGGVRSGAEDQASRVKWNYRCHCWGRAGSRADLLRIAGTCRCGCGGGAGARSWVGWLGEAVLDLLLGGGAGLGCPLLSHTAWSELLQFF